MSTIDKAFELVNQFTTEKAQISLAEMSGLTGFDKSTTRRLLLSLVKNGMLEQLPNGAGYQLGTLPQRLARVRKHSSSFDQHAEKILTKLVADTNESAHIVALRGGRLTHHSVVEPLRATRVSFSLQEDVQYHATASGLCYLAFLGRELEDRALNEPLEKLTPFTETDPDRIRHMLPEIRKNMSAIAINTRESDVTSVAAPFFNGDENFAGTLAIAMPSHRFTKPVQKAVQSALKLAVRELTEAVGGQFPR